MVPSEGIEPSCLGLEDPTRPSGEGVFGCGGWSCTNAVLLMRQDGILILPAVSDGHNMLTFKPSVVARNRPHLFLTKLSPQGNRVFVTTVDIVDTIKHVSCFYEFHRFVATQTVRPIVV